MASRLSWGASLRSFSPPPPRTSRDWRHKLMARWSQHFRDLRSITIPLHRKARCWGRRKSAPRPTSLADKSGDVDCLARLAELPATGVVIAGCRAIAAAGGNAALAVYAVQAVTAVAAVLTAVVTVMLRVHT